MPMEIFLSGLDGDPWIYPGTMSSEVIQLVTNFEVCHCKGFRRGLI